MTHQFKSSSDGECLAEVQGMDAEPEARGDAFTASAGPILARQR